ncbi:hypothetical protein EUGRSUZ_G01050 [Eucalyptus grandis]|uniref:Uncharacterized protein n=2 Tax=Eucalyptus grandis TaxID=71139 RepID=A0ACC3K2U4_EUCGR|nr:hypothetical protein EUGRSUZ_G01050 [Eucalyptus grandis]
MIFSVPGRWLSEGFINPFSSGNGSCACCMGGSGCLFLAKRLSQLVLSPSWPYCNKNFQRELIKAQIVVSANIPDETFLT